MTNVNIKVTDGAGNSATATTSYSVSSPSSGLFRDKRPMIVGGATTNDQTKFNAINNEWGPIRVTREYDSGGGIKAVNNYAWYNFAVKNFKYIIFSADEGNADYPRIAAGVFDPQIKTMIDSVNNLLVPKGIKGVIDLGNEPNTDKGISASDYRAALEHVIDTFGDEPAPGWVWGVAFSNYNVWGGNSTAGEAWLPRRPDKKFCVETHFYGKTNWADPADALGRTFVPAMNKPGRKENWIWGIGETSAQENPNNPNTKGDWLIKSAEFVAANGGSFYCPFDTGVGGSDEVGSTPTTSSKMKTISVKYQNNNWTA